MYWLSNRLTATCEYTCVVLAVTDVMVCLYRCLPGTLETNPFPAVLIALSFLHRALASFESLEGVFKGSLLMISVNK